MPNIEEFTSADDALRAKVTAGRVADHFGLSKREVQIMRFRLGLIKQGPMYEYWAKVTGERP